MKTRCRYLWSDLR